MKQMQYIYENVTVVLGVGDDEAGVPVRVVCIVASDKIVGIQFFHHGSLSYEVGREKVDDFFKITLPSPMLEAIQRAWRKKQQEGGN
jgi:hypothetical protein